MQFVSSWLLSLWPTLRVVNWENDSQDETKSSIAASDTLASGLNGVIDLLQEVGQTKLRICRDPNVHVHNLIQNTLAERV